MNRLPLLETDWNSIQLNRLFFEAHQMHFNSSGQRIIESQMFEATRIKITPALSIDSPQNIFIKSGGDPFRVVVGCMENTFILL